MEETALKSSQPVRWKIERVPTPMGLRFIIPLLAVVITFLITSILIVAAGANPIEAYIKFFVAPLSSRMSAIEVLVKATPLILTGMAVIFAFSAGYYNIGAEGQLYAGAISAAGMGMALHGLPVYLTIPIMLVVGFLAGMAWASIPAFLKARLAVDEVVTTLLLNTVILFVISYLLNGPWRDPISGWPQSPQILPNTEFIKLIPRSRLHVGFIVSLLSVVAVWFLLFRTSLGLKMRAVGQGKEAARFAGIRVEKTMLIAALVSGGIAGLAGVGEVAGIHFHLIEALSPGYGYTGIIIATLGGLNPIGGTLAALFLGLIDTGAQTVSRSLGVPIYLGDVVQSTLLLVTLALFVLQNYRIRRV